MRILTLAVMASGLAGLVHAQTPPPSTNELRLSAIRESQAPALRALNQQDATMRLRAFSDAELEEVEQETTRILAATGTACDVVDSVRLGQTARRRDLFEVACANGYGYVLMNGPTPAAYDCWTLARVGMALRHRDRNASIGTQCGLEQNLGDLDPTLLARANRAR